MKRTICILLAAVTLLAILPFSGCSILNKVVKPKEDDQSSFSGDYGSASPEELAENAVKLAETCDVKLMNKLLPKGETDYYVNYYDGKGQDYWQLLQKEFDANAAHYVETIGDDWKITYEVTQRNDKDADGVANYREYDSFYFQQYGVDPAKIKEVTFIYYDVTVSGSLGSNTKQKSMWLFKYEGSWYSFYMPRFGLNLN